MKSTEEDKEDEEDDPETEEKSISLYDSALEAEIFQQRNVQNLQKNEEDAESYKSEPTVEITADDFLPQIQIEIEEARANRDIKTLRMLRMKERVLLLKEIVKKSKNKPMETQTVQTQDRSHQDLCGFSLQIFYFIKRNDYLTLIANVANANLYNLRARCPIYHVKAVDLNLDQNPRAEIEVLQHSDFYTHVVGELGLKKFTDVPEERE